MRTTMPKPADALERLNHAAPSGRSVKADLKPHTPACDMRTPAKDALRSVDKQEAAAEKAGISQARLSHKFTDGSLTLAQMEAFGPQFAVAYAEALLEHYATLATPRARIREQVRQMRRALDEVDQYLELVS